MFNPSAGVYLQRNSYLKWQRILRSESGWSMYEHAENKKPINILSWKN